MTETESPISYKGNDSVLDPVTYSYLKLDRPGQSQETLDVFQRMQKKGVPTADTITDVDGYLKEHKLTIEEAQKKVEEDFRKYKIVEANLTSQREKLRETEPDFLRGRELLTKLQEALANPDYEWPMEVRYPLADQVFSTAYVDKTDTIYILLGCQTMAEVTVDEADKIFSKNLVDINKLKNDLSEEINFVKDQITTTEVNMAHLFNYNVNLKKAAAGIGDKK